MRRGKVYSLKTAISLMLQAGDILSENLQLGAVAALAGRLFHLAIVGGKKLNWINYLVIRGS